MVKHTKLFYRAIARIRTLNVKNGSVLIERIKKVYNVGLIRAFNLGFELQEAGAIRAWNESDFKKSSKNKGNIDRENITKFKVPKEITKEESLKVKQEGKAGEIPETIAKSTTRKHRLI